MPIFTTGATWRIERPQTLVVACSDGRLQVQIDEFLREGLGVQEYDRLYLPGGPGALATSGDEFARSERATSELTFLLDAHKIESVLLLFHGPGPGGPRGSVCADYARKLRHDDPAKVRQQQEADAGEVLRRVFAFRKVEVRALFCDVREDLALDIVEYDLGKGRAVRHTQA